MQSYLTEDFISKNGKIAEGKKLEFLFKNTVNGRKMIFGFLSGS
jgi:hypothetical protein